MDFCGCRERFLPPGRSDQMGRSGNGAFPGAAELQVSFLSSCPCLMMGDWQPPETPPRGCRRKPMSTGAEYTPDGNCILLAARKDGHL